MLIGAHMTIGKGLTKAVQDALSIEGTTMQIFTRNPRGGRAKKIDYQDMEKSRQLIKEHNFGPWVAHAPYTINLCSAKPDVRQFGIDTILDDFNRMNIMGAGFLVVHAGSHTGQGEQKGEELLVEGLNKLLPHCPSDMFLLIEAMAGEGTEIGYKLERLQSIMDTVKNNANLGICLDTCHLFGAGYDVRQWEQLWQTIENTMDQNKVKVLHLNDSKFSLGLHKDRHEKITRGEIGEAGFKEILLHPSIRNIPLILETPNDLKGWAEEIKMIKKWWQEAGIF